MSAGDISMTGSAGDNHVPTGEDDAAPGEGLPLSALEAIRAALEHIMAELDQQGAAVSAQSTATIACTEGINDIRRLLQNVLDRQVRLENTFRLELRRIDVDNLTELRRLSDTLDELTRRSNSERAGWRNRLDLFFIWVRDRIGHPPTPPGPGFGGPGGPGFGGPGPGGAQGGAGIAV